MKKLLFASLIGIVFGSSITIAATTAFKDVPSSSWYTSSVKSLTEKGVIYGYEDSTFRPGNTVSRAELVVTLDRLITYLQATDHAQLDLNEAYSLAKNGECGEVGTVSQRGYSYSEKEQTWDFEITNVSKPGCGAWCSVYDQDSTVEVNWMCTGAE